MKRALADVSSERDAAHAAVLELMPLSLKVAELERRLYGEIQEHDELKVR